MIPSTMSIDGEWLSLSLSARGLLRELVGYVTSDGTLRTSLQPGASVKMVGNEVARLLCAHRGEYARVRRDVEQLLAAHFLSFQGQSIVVKASLETSSTDDVGPSTGGSTSAERMRRHRELAKARSVTVSASHVTDESVTSDGSDASPVTRALSLNQVKDPSPKRARDGRDASHRMPPDLPFDDGARAIALRVGVKKPELTWMAFKAHYLERGTSSRDWERVWETWVVREAKWEAAHKPPSPPPSTTPNVDLNAPWLLAAGPAR